MFLSHQSQGHTFLVIVISEGGLSFTRCDSVKTHIWELTLPQPSICCWTLQRQIEHCSCHQELACSYLDFMIGFSQANRSLSIPSSAWPSMSHSVSLHFNLFKKIIITVIQI